MRRLCDLYVGHAMYSVSTVNSSLVFVCGSRAQKSRSHVEVVVLFLDLS